MDVNAVADWFATERGIARETLRSWGVELSGSNVLFHYPNGVKERPDPTQPLREDQRRFYFTKGQTPLLYQHPDTVASDTAFLCEGETDTMRLWQELGGAYPVFGLGGINTWTDACAARLDGYKRVYVVLDNDQDYRVTGIVDTVWREIRKSLGARAKRVFLPKQVKDVCQLFSDGYDLAYFHTLCQRTSQSLYAPVDFTVDPPPVRWLLEGVFAMGDVNIVSGLGGLGKSFLTMGLTMAMLTGQPEFLDQELHQWGKVLYVDEENPLDVVHDRLRKMGLDPGQHATNLRYLWNQGVRLDRDPDRLLDEAVAFAPDLIVLDSLTRLHSGEENDVGFISPLLNDAIKPLARETGAAVIVLHHHDKNAKGARGSGDIRNAADGTYDVRGFGDQAEKLVLTPDKSRRKRAFDELPIGIEDQPDGTIKLTVLPGVNLIF